MLVVIGITAEARFDPEKSKKERCPPAHLVNLAFKCIPLNELFNIVKDVPNFSRGI
jgi:hypothetical protein